MRNRVLLRVLICALLLLAFAGAAAAQKELFTDQVELYSDGALPKESPMLASMFGVNAFEEYMLAQLNAQMERIDVSDYQLTPSEFRVLYQRMLNAHPEMFFVEGGYGYTLDTYVLSVLPRYAYTGDELERLQGIYEDGVDAIVGYARAASTDVGRMLRASDYMCANFEYDLSYSIYSPELLFESKTGVCQAYMLAYRAVLNELGIANIAVSSEEINHTWNMVYLDGNWYHIDVTWNDPISDIPLRAYHTNFLLSDEGITATGHTGWDDGWEDVVAADNAKYDDFFWINMNQAASMQGDVVYYAEMDSETISRNVYAYDLAGDQTSMIHTYNYGYGTYYKHYNPVWVVDGMVYYAVRDSLYRAPIAGGEAQLVYSTGDSDQWIWYPYQSGEQLNLYIAQTPGSEGSVYSHTLDLEYDLKLNRTVLQMEIGESARLNATLTPEIGISPVLTWSSADAGIASVSSAGKVSAAGAGVTSIRVKYGSKAEASCTVIVNPEEKLTLPTAAGEIQAEAFAGIAAGMIVLPDGVTEIGSRVFADNEKLILVNLPSSLVSVAEDAFAGSANVTLLCTAGSVGEAYAIAQRIPYVIVP